MGFAGYTVCSKLRHIMRDPKSSRRDGVAKNLKLVLKKGVDKVKLEDDKKGGHDKDHDHSSDKKSNRKSDKKSSDKKKRK